MTYKRISCFLGAWLTVTSCGGSGEPATSSSGADGSASAAGNVAPLVVNAGLAGAMSIDVPFASVTLCVPGTTTCQTIEDVSVDTGSSGMRVLASALSGSVALPQKTATTGEPLVECLQFADGYAWGSVRWADVKVAGEVAAHVPIQVIGDPAFASVPSECSSSGPSDDTVATFGSNGLLGINPLVPDCGASCADTSHVQAGAYYSCSGSSCTPVAVSISDQISNPIASFEADNNGAVLQFPAVPATGAATLSGSLIFGIGTQTNNALGGARVLTLDQYGDFTTVYDGKTFSTSFIDSGSDILAFNDTSIPTCTSAGLSDFYCPTSTLNLQAENRGQNGVTAPVSFTVESAETLFTNASNAAFDDVAGPGIDSSSFDWGFPFFLGRSVYFAVDAAATSGGKGPYVAY
jgi:hypothetical protein